MRASSVNLILLEILAKDQSHLTAQQIYERIRVKLPAVNASTVYRSLDRLVQAGRVSISDMGLGADVFELVGGELHHHLVCQECGAVTTIPNDDVHEFFAQLNRRHGFKVFTNHLILFGRCAACQEKDAE